MKSLGHAVVATFFFFMWTLPYPPDSTMPNHWRFFLDAGCFIGFAVNLWSAFMTFGEKSTND